MQPRPGKRRLHIGWLPMLVGTLLASAGVATGQDGRDAIEERLDQTVERVQINKLPIREALRELKRSTQIEFQIDDATVELLPYGAGTSLRITLENISVRQGLTQIFDGLGLAMHVGDGVVRVEPGPVLRRIGERMKITEIELINRLAEKSWAEVLKGGPIALQFEVSPESNPGATLERAIAQIPGASALRQLESATAALGWVWWPRESALVFAPRRDFVNRLLDRPMAFNYHRTPVDVLIEDIGRRAGVHISFEPGVLGGISARDRIVDSVTPKGTARQILERICGTVGLRYEVGEEGVRIFAPDGGPTGVPTTLPATATGGPSPVVAIVHKPIGEAGLSIDFLIREHELPVEIQSLRKDVLDEVLAELRKILAAKRPDAKP